MRSGYNVGSVIRSCDAFGFRKIITGGYSPSKDHPSVKSAAMGSEKWMSLLHVRNLEAYLKRRTKNGDIQIIALEITEGSKPLAGVRIKKSGILIIGNEERGISHDILDLCSVKAHIPMYGRKHSLNVSTAFGIAAHMIKSSVGQ